MFRQIGIATLIAAFTLGATPAYACTGISLKANDGAAIRGRTLEFGFPMRSNVPLSSRPARRAARCPTAARA